MEGLARLLVSISPFHDAYYQYLQEEKYPELYPDFFCGELVRLKETKSGVEKVDSKPI